MGGFTKFLLFSGCFIFFVSTQAQDLGQTNITLNLEPGTLDEVLNDLKEHLQVNIILTDSVSRIMTGKTYESVPLNEVLDDLLEGSGLSYLNYRNYLIVVGEEQALQENRPSSFYQTLQESIETSNRVEDELEMVIGHIDRMPSSGLVLLEGDVIDADTDEPIIGATLFIKETNHGTDTDEEGNFEIALNPGLYTLLIQYIGYQDRQIPVRIISGGSLRLTLNRSSILLDEVVVEAKKRDENIQSVQIGVTRLSIREIEKLPSFLGEVDIIKGLLQQPGVSTIGEGSSGFNVRGGTVDQNLILIDEGMIFNSSHALGFFSAFNSDILSDAVLHKGNIPAKYGGRLASALDVNVREGNFEKIRFKGGLGVVSSRLTLEGPIKSNKSSFLISGRSTYSDWILGAVKLPEVSESSAFFYDANAKFTHRINERNFISASLYSTADQFTYAGEFGFDYNTIMAQLHYRSVWGDRLFSTLSLIYSDYNSDQNDLVGPDASTLSIGNSNLKIKENVNLSLQGLDLDSGISFIHYRVNPGILSPRGDRSAVIPSMVPEETAREIAAYADATLALSPHLSLTGGLRFTLFQFLGPREMYEYRDPEHPVQGEITGRRLFGDKIVHQESLLQPRFSARYLIDANSSIKVGYARTSQYINQISNNDTPTPTSIWQLSNQYIPSQLSHNFSIGYFRNFSENIWNTGLEIYYRDIDRLIDYKDFADLIANNHLETELLRGTGKAYGMEVSLKKQVGVIHGWLNYTFARSQRRVEGINRQKWYPSNFDKPHDISLAANYQVNKRNVISLNFSYSTGRAINVPVDRHPVENNLIILNYSERNAFRAPDYHRLDISYTLGQGFRKSRKFKTSWTFSVYNVYARRNAFSIYVVQDNLVKPEIRRLSVLGNAFPSLTFNFELL